MKKLFCLFLMLVLLCIPVHNCLAGAPAENSALGKAIITVFKDYGDCYHNFFLWHSDIEEESRVCLGINAGFLAVVVLGFLATPLIAIAAGVGYMTILFASAEGIAKSAKVCRITPDSDDIQPAAYSDDMINQLLGGNASIEEIIDKYNKICVEYHGQRAWIKQNKCATLDGATFCAYTYLDRKATFVNSIQNDSPTSGTDPEYLCVRVSSTCPCSLRLQGGEIAGPEYQKDADGVYKLNSDGTPQIKDEAEYKAHAAKHCRALRRANAIPLEIKPPNTDIIDEVCYTWSGYSKNHRPLAAAIVQCVQNTLNNIFVKPMAISSNQSTLTSSQQITYNNYSIDYIYVTNVMDFLIKTSDEIISATVSQLQQDLQTLLGYTLAINNGTAFKGGPYGTGGSNFAVTTLQNQVSSAINSLAQTTILSYRDLGQIQQDLATLANKIDKTRETFMGQALQANSRTTALTPFQSVQGKMQTLVLIVLVIYVMMIGYRMIKGEFNPGVATIVPIFMDFAIVYYFAMGSAWRDYFFNMVLNVSVGLGEFVMGVTNDYVSDRGQDSCNNYMNNFYEVPSTPSTPSTPSITSTCTFPNYSILRDIPNATLAQLLVPKVVGYNQRTQRSIIGCMKGPFISVPNYKAPYQPVKVNRFNSDGTTTAPMPFMNVYCYNNSNSTQRTLATPINNMITLETIRLVCPSGYTMEDGYRISELVNAGFSLAKLNSSRVSGDSYGVVSTAVEIWDTATDRPINIIQNIASDAIKMRTASMKYGRTNVLESIRSFENSRHRSYPILTIFNGVRRDMSYVGMFDTLDCKVMKYLTYNPSQSDDIISLKFLVSILFTGPLGIAVFAIMVCMGFLFVSMIGTVVQGYLVSMGAITILAYLSPLVMPCLLFNDTKGYFNTWLGQMKKYATGVPVSLLTLGIMLVLTDYIFYGDPAQYSYNNMFNADGSINQSCGSNNVDKAPLMCLFYLMNRSISTSNCFFGICVSGTGNFNHTLSLLAIALLKAIIILNILVDSLGKIESFMNSMLGTSQDVALSGSIFNSSTGLFGYFKSASSSIVSAPFNMVGDLTSQISQSKQVSRTAENTTKAENIMGGK